MIIVTGTYDDQVDACAIVCFVQRSYLGLHVARYHAVTDRDKWMILSKMFSKYRCEAHP